MNKIAKQYCRRAKIFFPLYGKNERQYFKDFSSNVHEYCENRSVCELKQLYSEFGKPSEVAYSYFSNCDTRYIMRKLQLRKTIKISLLLLLVAFIIATLAILIFSYYIYQVWKTESVFFDSVIYHLNFFGIHFDFGGPF